MSQNYNKKRIRLFFLLAVPMIVGSIISAYYKIYNFTGLLLILFGTTVFIFRNEYSKYFYFKTYDTGIHFHCEDIEERKRYGNTNYEELRDESISHVLVKNIIVALISVIGGMFLIFFVN